LSVSRVGGCAGDDLLNETLDIEVWAKARFCAHTGLVPGTDISTEQVFGIQNQALLPGLL
jgi:hypothetical protein